MRILLDEKDFKELVSGRVVKQDGAEIMLKDIGYDVMLYIIEALKAKLYNK